MISRTKPSSISSGVRLVSRSYGNLRPPERIHSPRSVRSQSEDRSSDKYDLLSVNVKGELSVCLELVHGCISVQLGESFPDAAQQFAVFRSNGLQLRFEAVGRKGAYVIGKGNFFGRSARRG